MSSLYTAQDYTVFPYIINILVVVPEIVAEHPAVILEKYEFIRLVCIEKIGIYKRITYTFIKKILVSVDVCRFVFN